MQSPQLKFTDTHCHLYAAEFDHDRSEMIKRAIDTGIDRMMIPNIDMQSIHGMLELMMQFPQHCFPMIGLHPTSVKDDYLSNLSLMRNDLEKNVFVGIGETGVDL